MTYKKMLVAAIKAANDPKPEPKAPKVKPLTKKAEEVKRLVDTLDFGCKKATVAKLMSAVLGENICPPETKPKIPFASGTLFKVNNDDLGFDIGNIAIYCYDKENDYHYAISLNQIEVNDFSTFDYDSNCVTLINKDDLKSIISRINKLSEDSCKRVFKHVL